MRSLLVFSIFMLPFIGLAQDKAAYRIFDAEGKPVDYSAMMKKAQRADVVFIGELHNNPICHWLELEVTKDLHAAKEGKVVLGAEMFERDNQEMLDEYLSGLITQKSFEDEAKLWNNYSTDYKPLVEFAKAKKLAFIATNIPRRYANMVYRGGLESLNGLSQTAKNWIAPLPIEVDINLPSYQSMLKMMGGHGEPNLNFPRSQASKDATMAYSISQNLKKDHVFVHYNGAFHSDLHEGIIWYLKRYAPKADALTITSVEQDATDTLAAEHLKKADYIVVIPSSMTKTY